MHISPAKGFEVKIFDEPDRFIKSSPPSVTKSTESIDRGTNAAAFVLQAISMERHKRLKTSKTKRSSGKLYEVNDSKERAQREEGRISKNNSAIKNNSSLKKQHYEYVHSSQSPVAFTSDKS